MMENEIKKNKKTSSVKHLCHHGVYELHLNRPEKKNALNFAMYQELAETILSIQSEPAVRVLILTGSQGHFTSGNDLADFMQWVKSAKTEMPVLRFMQALKDFPKPVIAAVEGKAIGIGTTLLLHCDLIYAAEDTAFQLPFVSLGLCPEYASSLLLPKVVGYVKASEWLLQGKFFSAREALTAGMINCIAEDPLVVARETAKEISQLPSIAVQRTKALLKSAIKSDIDKAIEAEMALFSQALTEEAFAVAAVGFLKKKSSD